MSKIELSDVFTLAGINSNFQQLEDELNNKVLYRDVPVGEPNTMQNQLDMNGNHIYNLPVPTGFNEAARLQDIIDAGSITTSTAALTSFSPSGTISSTNVQGALQELDGDVQSIIGNFVSKTDLANTSDVTKGDALVGVKSPLANSVARTQHQKNQEWVSVLDFGADPTGVIEATAAFQNACNASRMVYIPPGVYTLGQVNLNTGQWLFGAGAAVTQLNKLTSVALPMLNADSGSSSSFLQDVYISGLTVYGQSDTAGFSEFSHLIAYNGVKNGGVYNVRFIAFRGDGMYIGSGNVGGQERHNLNIRVRDCFFDGINKTNRNGITIIDGDGVWIENNFFTRTSTSSMPGAIDIEPDAFTFHVIRNITVRGNKFYDIGGNQAAINVFLPGVAFTTTPQGFTFEDNYIDTVVAYGMIFQWNLTGGATDGQVPQSIRWRGNTVTGASAPFIVRNARDVIVESNRFYNCPNAALVSLGTANDRVLATHIKYNFFGRIGANSGTGLLVTNVNRLDIVGNEFSDCGSGTPGAASSIDFGSTSTSVAVTICNNNFQSPTGLTLVAIQKEATHTFTTNTNSQYGNRFNSLANGFVVAGSESAVPTIIDGQTYTPVVQGITSAGTGTYTNQEGKFTRVGNLVHFQIAISWSAHTGTGQARVSLPVTPSTTNNNTSVAVISFFTGTAGAGNTVIGLLNRTTGFIDLYTLNGGASAAFAVPAAGTTHFAGSYLA